MAAISSSHPEIIISDEFKLLYKFDSFFMAPSQTDDERKLRIFYDLHTRSRRQAMKSFVNLQQLRILLLQHQRKLARWLQK